MIPNFYWSRAVGKRRSRGPAAPHRVGGTSGAGDKLLPPPVGVTSGAGGTTALSVLKHFTVGCPITLHTTTRLKMLFSLKTTSGTDMNIYR